MRKEYLVLKKDPVGEADIVGVFSSRRKARAAVEADSTVAGAKSSYWMIVLIEDRLVKGLTN